MFGNGCLCLVCGAFFIGFDETQPLPYFADGTLRDDTLGDDAVEWTGDLDRRLVALNLTERVEGLDPCSLGNGPFWVIAGSVESGSSNIMRGNALLTT